MSEIAIPALSLVVLVGASSSGKSTFARQHFRPTEIVSSDACRALISDDEGEQAVNEDAFALLRQIAGLRLKQGRLVVIDATNTTPEARAPFLALAKEHHCLAAAVVLDVPLERLLERHAAREDRSFHADVIRRQNRQMRRYARGLRKEGFRFVHHLRGEEEIAAATFARTRLWSDRRDEGGPFDIIGDVHGCYDELVALLGRLGWDLAALRHPAGRRAIFLGDLVDRGPASPAVLRLVMDLVAAGSALCVPGNHEAKLLKALRGHSVRPTHGLAETLEQMAAEPPEFAAKVAEFIDGLVSHYVLDGGRLVVAHAGLKAELQGRASGRVREFCLYGETTGETDEFGLPVRYDWASEYRGSAQVIYGHTPVPRAEWVGRTLCLDTGCVFGGALTALRYPEQELVSAPAAREYYAPIRPLRPANSDSYDLLDLGDLVAGFAVTTPWKTVRVRAEQAAAALESMSRFAVDPRWLIYLPPTMSPCETAPAGAPLLERPQEALGYYRRQGIPEVVCEEKHMGSRAVVVLCRDAATAAARFGDDSGRRGAAYTRTGRAFFSDPALEAAFLERLAAAAERAGLWKLLDSAWLALDGEIMPWSAKALSLLQEQYAPAGAAGRASLGAAVQALSQAAARAPGAAPLLARYQERLDDIERYTESYRRYCWEAADLSGYRFAPFHLLASEGRVHTDKDHAWHMRTLAELAQADPGLLLATPYRVVDLEDEAAVAAAIQWWEGLTAAGGEGVVIKPRDWINLGDGQGARGLIQPAIKCRGPEYLRIIYGPHYTAQLERLRERGIGRKRALALQEFVLGVEGLRRFAAGEPLRRVHPCAFGVLALESDPVDPRL